MKILVKKIKNGSAVIALRTKDGEERCSAERGIKPLLILLEDASAPLHGAIVADKVVGKAAAFLFVVGKVKQLHAVVLSVPAKMVLERYGIEFTYDELTDKILNRDKTGFCPMETKVWDIETPQEAYGALKG